MSAIHVDTLVKHYRVCHKIVPAVDGLTFDIERGGQIVAHDSPEQIATNKASYTGPFLKKHLGNKR